MIAHHTPAERTRTGRGKMSVIADDDADDSSY
jgi:hypothetical protein